MFLTENQVLDYLKISRTHLYTLRRRGKIPYYKFEGAVRYKQSDVDAFVERCRKGA